MSLRLQSSRRLGDTNGMIDTNVSRADCTETMQRRVRPIILLVGKRRCVISVSMNGSSHSSIQDVSVFHMRSGWHADPSQHISAGVFLLWLFKLLRKGQRVRLIQLRGQQARVISVLPSHRAACSTSSGLYTTSDPCNNQGFGFCQHFNSYLTLNKSLGGLYNSCMCFYLCPVFLNSLK